MDIDNISINAGVMTLKRVKKPFPHPTFIEKARLPGSIERVWCANGEGADKVASLND
jgi:hypothetical protein